MKAVRKFLTIVPPGFPPARVAGLVANAIELAIWLSSEVCFLVGGKELHLIEAAISRVAHGRTSMPSTLTLQCKADNLLESISETSRTCDLALMENGVVREQTKGIDERKIIELSEIPVLLIQRSTDLRKTRPSGFLVPISGEQRMSSSISMALALAKQTDTHMDLMHVASNVSAQGIKRRLEELGDQVHHEYKNMLDRIVSEGSPFSAPSDKCYVREFSHREGSIDTEITKALQERPGDILVLEWGGTLAHGRAKTIKAILKTTSHPVLFIKVAKEERSQLKVGKAFFNRHT